MHCVCASLEPGGGDSSSAGYVLEWPAALLAVHYYFYRIICGPLSSFAVHKKQIASMDSLSPSSSRRRAEQGSRGGPGGGGGTACPLRFSSSIPLKPCRRGPPGGRESSAERKAKIAAWNREKRDPPSGVSNPASGGYPGAPPPPPLSASAHLSACAPETHTSAKVAAL